MPLTCSEFLLHYNVTVYFMLTAIIKRSTIPVFKSHGMAQAKISDCATETFSAIRTVSLYITHSISINGMLLLR